VPHFNALAGMIPANIAINDISLKLDSLAYISAAESILQPLLRNPSRKIPNSVKLRYGYGYYAVQGNLSSSKVTEFGTNRKLIWDFPLVINTKLAPILHRFRDIAFDWSKIAIFGYPSCVTPPKEKFESLGRSMAKVPNGVETLPKISIA